MAIILLLWLGWISWNCGRLERRFESLCDVCINSLDETTKWKKGIDEWCDERALAQEKLGSLLRDIGKPDGDDWWKGETPDAN